MNQWWKDRLTRVIDDLSAPVIILVVAVVVAIYAGPRLAQQFQSYF